jgi:hypothetical protein
VLAIVCLVSDLRSYFYYVFVFPRRLAANGTWLGRFELLYLAAGSHLFPVFGLCAGIALVGTHRLFAALLLAIGIAICLASPIGHPHYWISLIPFLIASFLTGVARDGKWTRKLEKVALATVFMVILGALATGPLSQLGGTGEYYSTLEEVVALADKNKRGSDTLTVFAPLGYEYIQFHSKLMPANKYAVPWELDSNKGALADSFQEIGRSYIERPPTSIVVHQDLLLELVAAKSNKPQRDVPQSVLLLTRLFQERHYREVGQLHGLHVAVLEETPAR